MILSFVKFSFFKFQMRWPAALWICTFFVDLFSPVFIQSGFCATLVSIKKGKLVQHTLATVFWLTCLKAPFAILQHGNAILIWFSIFEGKVINRPFLFSFNSYKNKKHQRGGPLIIICLFQMLSNLSETLQAILHTFWNITLLPRFFVFWERGIKFWLLTYFLFLYLCKVSEKLDNIYIWHFIMVPPPLWIFGILQKQRTGKSTTIHKETQKHHWF